MNWLRKFLRAETARRLRAARHGLCLVPGLPELHAIVCAKHLELGRHASLAMSCRLLCYASYIQRRANKAKTCH